MNNQYNRLEIMLKDDLERLQNNTVAVIGIGGVGGAAIEALARCGIRKLIIVDKDVVDITNINRQIIATHSTIGRLKTEVMKERILDINPLCEVIDINIFCDQSTFLDIIDHKPDFVIDACDTISAKYSIIETCLKQGIPFVSSMGAANKEDATKVEIIDLMKTTNDPVAKALRSKLRKEKVYGKIPVVFSAELPKKPKIFTNNVDVVSRKELPLLGSNSFVPPTFGIIAANYCFNRLLVNKK